MFYRDHLNRQAIMEIEKTPIHDDHAHHPDAHGPPWQHPTACYRGRPRKHRRSTHSRRRSAPAQDYILYTLIEFRKLINFPDFPGPKNLGNRTNYEKTERYVITPLVCCILAKSERKKLFTTHVIEFSSFRPIWTNLMTSLTLEWRNCENFYINAFLTWCTLW